MADGPDRPRHYFLESLWNNLTNVVRDFQSISEQFEELRLPAKVARSIRIIREVGFEQRRLRQEIIQVAGRPPIAFVIGFNNPVIVEPDDVPEELYREMMNDIYLSIYNEVEDYMDDYRADNDIDGVNESLAVMAEIRRLRGGLRQALTFQGA